MAVRLEITQCLQLAEGQLVTSECRGLVITCLEDPGSNLTWAVLLGLFFFSTELNDWLGKTWDVPVKPYSVRFSAIYSLWHGLHGAGKMSGYARLLQLTESDDAIHAMHGMDVVMAFNQCWRIRILRFFRLLKTRFYVF